MKLQLCFPWTMMVDLGGVRNGVELKLYFIKVIFFCFKLKNNFLKIKYYFNIFLK